MIQIGCIADDFTGASDWASFFAEKGISEKKETYIFCAGFL